MSDIDFIKAHISYNPDTGVFTRIKSRNKNLVNKPINAISNQTGYLIITIGSRPDLRRYQAHRVAWAIYQGEWPNGFIDHINRIRTDNRICNLRECSRGENKRNTHRPEKNKTGAKGVEFIKNNKTKPWRARVTVNRKPVFDRCFPTFEEANQAAIEARERLHGEFACHG